MGMTRCVHLPAQPAADPRAGQRHRLHLPPAGPRRQRPRGAAGGAQPAAGHGRRRASCWPACAPTDWKTRRSCSSTSTATRPARWAWASTPSTRRSPPRFGSTYVNDFPSAGPAAARGGAGRRAGAHAARRPAAAATRSTAAASWCRCRPSRRHAGSPGRCRRCATTATRRCASPATPRPASAPARRWPRWSGWPRSCRRASASSGPASRARNGCPARTALILFGFSLLAVFLCLAALYESWSIPLAVLLVVPLGVLGVRARRRRCAACSNDVYFKVGLITIIGLSAKNAMLIIEFAKDLQAQGKSAGRGGAAGRAPALPADRDDLAGLHPGRAAAGHRQRRRLGQPARDRHRRDGRHDHRDAAGGALRAGVLRGGAALVQGQRTPAQAACARGRCAHAGGSGQS